MRFLADMGVNLRIVEWLRSALRDDILASADANNVHNRTALPKNAH
jgi:hypothetical protein